MHRIATFPVLLITAGLLWFLHSTALLPNAHSLVAIGLAVAGAAMLLLDGLNKSTLVSCPMLMYASLVVYGREHFALPFSVWASCGMVLLGLLLLAARSSAVPERSRRRPD